MSWQYWPHIVSFRTPRSGLDIPYLAIESLTAQHIMRHSCLSDPLQVDRFRTALVFFARLSMREAFALAVVVSALTHKYPCACHAD